MYLFKKMYWFSKFRWTHHLYMSYGWVHPNFFFFSFFFLFWESNKEIRVWYSLSHVSRYSWVSPWVPPTRIGVWKKTFRNCNYSPRENLNLGCGESFNNHLSIIPHPLVVGPSKFQMWKLKTKMVRLFGICV